MRVYNFSAGPSMLPLEVLEECRNEMTDYNLTGQSVMEMSHRSADYEPIIRETEKTLRRVMKIPDNYTVLFLQGGASTQFACVPLNLCDKNRAAYIDTGIWSKKAIAEARRAGVAVDVVASSEEAAYSFIPKVERISGDYDYAYICMNNTIVGTKFPYIPDTGDIPLVADISSCVLSEELDVSKFALLFAGAQKNLGMAGVTLVIIRSDLIRENKKIPTMLSYKTHADAESMYNTPPTYAIYVMGKVLSWIEKQGGVSEMGKTNAAKAQKLYEYLDSSDFYRGTAQKESRSLMNVPFVFARKEDDVKEKVTKFVSEAALRSLVNLKGHRLVGGMRASIYNAMPLSGVEALISFMQDFERENK